MKYERPKVIFKTISEISIRNRMTWTKTRYKKVPVFFFFWKLSKFYEPLGECNLRMSVTFQRLRVDFVNLRKTSD